MLGRASGTDSIGRPGWVGFVAAFGFILLSALVTGPASAQPYTYDFARVAGELQVNGDKDGGVIWLDFDDDGCLDALINTQQNSLGSSLFWQSESAGVCQGTFVDVTSCLASGLNGPLMPTQTALERSVIAGDINNDGYIDFLRDTAGAGSSRGQSVEAYLSNGPGTNTCGQTSLTWSPFGTTSTDPGDLPNITFKHSPASAPLGDVQDARVVSPPGYDLNAELVGWLDYNADGWLDIIIDTHNHGIFMALNDGDFSFDGGFVGTPFAEDTLAGPPVGSFVGGGGSDGDYGAVADLDTDGDVDLLTRKSSGSGSFGDDVYLNNGVGPVTWFPTGPANRRDIGEADNRNKGGTAVCDFDSDGDFDIFWTGGVNGNRLWRNDGVRLAAGVGNLTLVSFYEDGAVFNFPTGKKTDGVVCADFNNDTRLDLYLTMDDGSSTGTSSDPNQPEGDYLFLNLGTIDPGGGVGLVPNFRCMMGPNNRCANNGGENTNNNCNAAPNDNDIGCGDGEGVAAGDYDRDGDVDLLVNQNGPGGNLNSITSELYANGLCDGGCPANNEYVVIRAIESAIPNSSAGFAATGERDAIGATIRLYACENPLAEVTGVREVNGGRGHGSQDPPYVHFGLGTPLTDVAAYDEYIAHVRFVGGTIAQTCFSLSDFSGGYQFLEIRDTDGVEEVGQCCAPTAALVTDFRGYEQGGNLVLEWQTGFEAGTAGFDIFRSDPDSPEPVKVSEDFLPAYRPSPQGSTHRWIDGSATPPYERYSYVLVEKEAWGSNRLHGPFRPGLHGSKKPLEAPSGATFVRTPKPMNLVAGPPVAPARLVAAAEGTTQIRLHVTENGFYRVTAAEISSLTGQPETTVRNAIRDQNVAVSQLGGDVGWLAPGSGAALYFYGEAIDSIYTNENVYWLDLGRQGITMTSSVAPSPPTAPATFLDSMRVEDNVFSTALIGANPSYDMWYWEVLVGNQKTFDFDPIDPDVGGSGGSVTVTMHGAVAQPHRVQVWLNSSLLGEASWSGVTRHVQSFPVAPGELVAGTNTIKLTDVGPSIVYVDAFDVAYQRFYTAYQGSLLFSADGNSPITVSGFTPSDIFLFDVSNPESPVRVEGRIDMVGGKNRFSFVPGSPASEYVVFTVPAILSPDRLVGDDFGDLKNSSNRADWVLITSQEMQTPAQELVDYRNGTFEAKLVLVQDIYDEFSYGIADPNAIRDFLEFASANWTVVPEIAVAGGKGHHDYKDYLGIGGNIVPPLMTQTAWGTYATDLSYVDFATPAPTIAFGRIPARDETQFQVFVDKLKAYEGAGGTWTGEVTILADDPDQGGEFHATSDDLAKLLPQELTAEKIYLPVGATQTEIDATRQQLFDKLDDGTVLVNFFGHGSLDRLAAESLLHKDDVPGLTNAPRLPMLTAMTCIIARFGHPQIVSLGEDLVLHGAGGTIGVLAPTGLSTNFDSGRLDELIFEELLSGSNQSFGDAWTAALASYVALWGSLDPVVVYNYLGDPGAPLK